MLRASARKAAGDVLFLFIARRRIVSDILFRGLPFFLFNGKFVTTAINELSK